MGDVLLKAVPHAITRDSSIGADMTSRKWDIQLQLELSKMHARTDVVISVI